MDIVNSQTNKYIFKFSPHNLTLLSPYTGTLYCCECVFVCVFVPHYPPPQSHYFSVSVSSIATHITNLWALSLYCYKYISLKPTLRSVFVLVAYWSYPMPYDPHLYVEKTIGDSVLLICNML